MGELGYFSGVGFCMIFFFLLYATLFLLKLYKKHECFTEVNECDTYQIRKSQTFQTRYLWSLETDKVFPCSQVLRSACGRPGGNVGLGCRACREALRRKKLVCVCGVGGVVRRGWGRQRGTQRTGPCGSVGSHSEGLSDLEAAQSGGEVVGRAESESGQLAKTSQANSTFRFQSLHLSWRQ